MYVFLVQTMRPNVFVVLWRHSKSFGKSNIGDNISARNGFSSSCTQTAVLSDSTNSRVVRVIPPWNESASLHPCLLNMAAVRTPISTIAHSARKETFSFTYSYTWNLDLILAHPVEIAPHKKRGPSRYVVFACGGKGASVYRQGDLK